MSVNLMSEESFNSVFRFFDPGACLRMLYGLQGAIHGIKDTFLTESTKQDLKAFYKNL